MAAPLETGKADANPQLLVHILKRALPGPYKFELEAHPSVEMTLFHQEEKERLLVGLLSMQETFPVIPVGATVRVLPPAGRTIKRVYKLPDHKEVAFEKAGAYEQFRLDPFDMFSLLTVEYE